MLQLKRKYSETKRTFIKKKLTPNNHRKQGSRKIGGLVNRLIRIMSFKWMDGSALRWLQAIKAVFAAKAL